MRYSLKYGIAYRRDQTVHQQCAKGNDGLLARRSPDAAVLRGVPEGSRASKPHGFLKKANITEDKLAKVKSLNVMAKERGQSLAQMALAWVMRRKTVTSALIGASSAKQIEDCVATIKRSEFTEDELSRIEKILKG